MLVVETKVADVPCAGEAGVAAQVALGTQFDRGLLFILEDLVAGQSDAGVKSGGSPTPMYRSFMLGGQYANVERCNRDVNKKWAVS